MAIKPISIRMLEDRFVCGCAEERADDDVPARVTEPRAGSFRLRTGAAPATRRSERNDRTRPAG